MALLHLPSKFMSAALIINHNCPTAILCRLNITITRLIYAIFSRLLTVPMALPLLPTMLTRCKRLVTMTSVSLFNTLLHCRPTLLPAAGDRPGRNVSWVFRVADDLPEPRHSYEENYLQRHQSLVLVPPQPHCIYGGFFFVSVPIPHIYFALTEPYRHKLDYRICPPRQPRFRRIYPISSP